jgi:hypothetical protein
MTPEYSPCKCVFSYFVSVWSLTSRFALLDCWRHVEMSVVHAAKFATVVEDAYPPQRVLTGLFHESHFPTVAIQLPQKQAATA